MSEIDESCKGQNGAGRIFVIDDDPVFVSSVVTILEQAGHQVESATDPLEALRGDLPDPPDIILLSTTLPKLSEAELMNRIKDSCRKKGIKIIAVSSLNDEEDIAKGWSVRTDFTYPLLKLLSSNIELYFMVQRFDGYAESLIDFREKRHATRIGFSLIR